MRDPIGTALAGIGIRGSAPTHSFLATEFSTARLAGDFILPSMLGGGHSDMDSGTATDSPGASIITSTTTITLGGLVSITILACAAAGSPLVAAHRVFTVVRASEVEALAEDSMVAAAEASTAVVVAVTDGKARLQQSSN
jgi:hypothetical protein